MKLRNQSCQLILGHCSRQMKATSDVVRSVEKTNPLQENF